MKRTQAFVALVLLVPAPSLGVLAGMMLFPGTLLGKGLFAASKLWLFLFPVLWLALVERERISFSPLRRGGLGVGALTGIGISLVILLAYAFWGAALLDRALFVSKMQAVGLGAWSVYLGAAAYWILVNSVLEEYVWRWFVYTRCERLARPAVAVVLSALCFTLHHFLALQTFFSVPLAALCSLGVFIGGAFWSWLYRRYRSIWPAYLSHAIVDLAVFGLGAALLLG
jgi:membrane protease YdiL (CAAX protease family)